jgi:penicillin-binding protein 1A
VAPPAAYGPAVVPASAEGPATPAPLPPDGEAAPASDPLAAAAPAAGGHALPESGIEPEVAFVLSSMMREVVEYGTGQAAKSLGRPVAGKTGTAQEHRDAWFVGFSPDLVSGVWVGFDSHDPLGPHETGAGAALPAWNAFMRGALARRPPADFVAPAGVDVARIDPKTGLLAEPTALDAQVVPFVAGTAPTRLASDPAPGSAPQNFFMDGQ